MFCERCGTKLSETACFCRNCGTSITRKMPEVPNDIMNDIEIQLHVQPSFKFGYMVLPTLTLYIIFILILSLIIGLGNASFGVLIFFVSIFILFISLGIKTVINKKQYNSFCYDFYKTKVIYKDSFLYLSEKEVKYKYIREVMMRQTFMQKKFNIGDIILLTSAENSNNNGIRIMNVENVQDVYRNIKSLIDESSTYSYSNNRIEQHIQEKMIENNYIKFQLKPKFNLTYKIISNIGFGLLYLYLYSYIFGLYYSSFQNPVILLISIVIIIIVKTLYDKKRYDNLEYNFYATKVEYKNQFLNREEKELEYKYIREVTMSQNFLERFFHIGKIKIFTNASSGTYNGKNHSGMKSKNGICIHCVDDVQEQYRVIKQIIDEGTTLK